MKTQMFLHTAALVCALLAAIASALVAALAWSRAANAEIYYGQVTIEDRAVNGCVNGAVYSEELE